MTSAIAPEPDLTVDSTSLPSEHTTSTPLNNVTEDSAPMSSPIVDPIPAHTLHPPAVLTEDQDDDHDDESDSLEHDHPSFAKATISLIIQLLPEDGHQDGRLALIAVKSHNLAPRITTQRLGTLAPLPDSITTLLQQWNAALPEALSQRQLARAHEQEVQRLKEEEQKAQRAAATRPDHKKAKTVKPTVKPNAVPPPITPLPLASQPDLF